MINKFLPIATFNSNTFAIVLVIIVVLILASYFIYAFFKKNATKSQQTFVEEVANVDDIDEVSQDEIEEEVQDEIEAEVQDEIEAEVQDEIAAEGKVEVIDAQDEKVEEEALEKDEASKLKPIESTLSNHHMEDLVRESISVEEASDVLPDNSLSELVNHQQIKLYGGKRERYIVNIDMISEKFQNNEEVNLESLKAKGLLPKKCNFFKVLARGTLNKSLSFIANDYSRDAIKMILLTGGNVTILEEIR